MKLKLEYDCIDTPDYYRGSSNLMLQIEAYNGQTIGDFKNELKRIINNSTLDEFVLCKDSTEDIVEKFMFDHNFNFKDNEVLVTGLFEEDDATFYHYIDVIVCQN